MSPERFPMSIVRPVRTRDCILVLIGLLLGIAISWHQHHDSSNDLKRRQVQLSALRGTVEPLYDHSQTEAIYRASQQTVMRYLESHNDIRLEVDLWFLMAPFYNCPSRQRIGHLLDGGKWVCAMRQLLSHNDCTIYSIGSNGETSFENAILADYPHCQMHTYDHTLSKELQTKVAGTQGVTLHSQGILSTAALAKEANKDAFTTLALSMVQNNATWLDILKIDIEGAEWEIFMEYFDERVPMPFTQILVEVHTSATSRISGKQHDVLTRFFRGMSDAGYRIFSVEANYLDAQHCLEFSFIKVDERGYFMQNQLSSKKVF